MWYCWTPEHYNSDVHLRESQDITQIRLFHHNNQFCTEKFHIIWLIFTCIVQQCLSRVSGASSSRLTWPVKRACFFCFVVKSRLAEVSRHQKHTTCIQLSVSMLLSLEFPLVILICLQWSKASLDLCTNHPYPCPQTPSCFPGPTYLSKIVTECNYRKQVISQITMHWH